jgi:hypothetical protein
MPILLTLNLGWSESQPGLTPVKRLVWHLYPFTTPDPVFGFNTEWGPGFGFDGGTGSGNDTEFVTGTSGWTILNEKITFKNASHHVFFVIPSEYQYGLAYFLWFVKNHHLFTIPLYLFRRQIGHLHKYKLSHYHIMISN